MTGSVVNAATLKNTIKYQTHQASLRKVREDMKKLQKDFSKVDGTIAKAKQKADKQTYTAQVKQQKSVDKQQRDIAKQAALDVKAKANEQKKLAAAQSKAAKIQLQQQAKTSKVNENAMLAQRKAHFDLGRLQHLGGAERYAALKHATSLVEQYKQGALSLRDMTQQLSMHMSQTKAIARNNGKKAKQSGTGGKSKSGSSGWLSRQANALLPSDLMGPIAGAFAVQQAYQIMSGTLAGAVERQRGRKLIQSYGGTDLEYQSIRREALNKTGFDLSTEKYADISKDWLDKQGDLSFGATNAKTGAFSGGGELSDLVNTLRTRMGYSNQGAVNKLNSMKTPVEFGVFMHSLRDAGKITEAEFVNFGERINDMSYVLNSVSSGGENLLKVQRELVDSNLALNNEQQKAIDNLIQMSTVFTQAKESLGDQFAASFSQSLQDAGLNTDNLSKEMGNLTPLVQDLGDTAGKTVKGFSDLLSVLSAITEWKNKILGEGSDNQSYLQTAASGAVNSIFPNPFTLISRGKDLWDMATGDSGYTPSSIYQQRGEFGFSKSSAMAYQPSLPDIKAEVTVNVTPSDEFGNMVQTTADQRIEWAFSDQAFQINQSLLGE